MPTRLINRSCLFSRHNSVSELHRENLESWRRRIAATCGGGGGGPSYRDRAKERRQKYGGDVAEDTESKRNQ